MNNTYKREEVVLSLHFGAAAKPLSEQLIDSGCDFKKRNVQHFQRDADAITRLYIRGMLSDKETERARHRLINAIKESAEY